jgi:hypothetical protein
VDFESYARFGIDLVSSEPDELESGDPLRSLDGLRAFLGPAVAGPCEEAGDLAPLVRLRSELRAVFDHAAEGPPTASVSRPSPNDRGASTGGRGVTRMAQHSRGLSRVPYERLGPYTPLASTRSIGPSPPGRPCRRIGNMFVTRRTRRCRSRRCRGSGRSRWRGDPTERSGREGEHPQAAGLGLALLFVSPRPWRPGSGGPGNAGATSTGRRPQLHRSPPRPAVQGPSRRRRTPRWPRRPTC